MGMGKVALEEHTRRRKMYRLVGIADLGWIAEAIAMNTRVYREGYALTSLRHLQIQNPSNAFEVYERSVSSGDHSFVASQDGKFEYCFSNEHWSANSKEVSFNVHGIVYVPESEAPQDPLEKEGKCMQPTTIVCHS
jgi:hypothetical protein